MNSQSSISGKFEPIHDAHAIEQVIIAINFQNPITEESMKEVRRAMDIFKNDDDLPGYSELQRLLSFGPGIINNLHSQGTTNGFVMYRAAPNGAVIDELTIAPESISFRTTAYTRWNDVWGKFSRFLKAIVEIYFSKSAAMQISLNTIDKFKWVGEVTTSNPSLLLRANSRYVCPHIYDQKDLWHSHTGVFLRIDDFTKRLLNINIDCLDDLAAGNASRVIAISTALTDFLNQPGYKPHSTPLNEAFNSLYTRITALHNMSKKCFADVISDEMCARIALVNKP